MIDKNKNGSIKHILKTLKSFSRLKFYRGIFFLFLALEYWFLIARVCLVVYIYFK